MACGCGKKRQNTNNTSTAGNPPQLVTRRVVTPAQSRRVTPPHRPHTTLKYYLKAPDGTEQPYNTLAEAQQALRKHGGPKSGYVIEPRRT